jgi:hypothetical protein
MALLRAIGWLLLLAGLMILGRDLIAYHDAPMFAPLSLRELWRTLAPASVPATPAILDLWSAPAFLVAGLVLLAFRRVRRRPRRAIRSPF